MERELEFGCNFMSKGGKEKNRGDLKIPRGKSKPKGRKEKRPGGAKRIPQKR